MKRYDEALADHNRAVELDPSHIWVIASRGHTYLVMRRFGKALADLKRGLKIAFSGGGSQDRDP
jgi:tetratricopeptide (TPR) repeat protein